MCFTSRSFYGGGGFGGGKRNRWRNNVVQLLLPAPNVSDDDFNKEVNEADSDVDVLSSASEESEELVESNQSDIDIETNQPEEIKDIETKTSDVSSNSGNDLCPWLTLQSDKKGTLHLNGPKRQNSGNDQQIQATSIIVTKNSKPKEFFSLFVTNELWQRIKSETELCNTWRTTNGGSC